MKRISSLVVCLLFVFSLFVLPEFSEDAKVEAAGNTLVSNVKEQHPRLLVDDFGKIKKKIKSDPMLTKWYEVFKARVDEDLPNIIEYDIDLIASNPMSGTLPTQRIGLPKFTSLAFMANMETNNKKYLDALAFEIEAACNLPNWNRGHWLGNSEMIQCISFAYDWCYKWWTEDQRELMLRSIIDKGLQDAKEIYEGKDVPYGWHKGFDGSAIDTVANWTNVCNSGVIIGSLVACDLDPDLTNETLTYALRSITVALHNFTEKDGGYVEGSGYWNYALYNSILASASIESAFEGNYSKLPELDAPNLYNFLDYDGIANAGNYAMYMFGPARMGANYGDATADAINSSVLLYMGNKTNRPEYINHYLNNLDITQERLNFFANALIWYDPNMDLTADSVPLDMNFELGLSTMRNSWAENTNGLFVAFKAGKNRGAHQHFDLGAYAIDAHGLRFIKLPGGGSYAWPRYMTNDGRILYYKGRPEGNNTIVINPDDTAGQVMDCITTLENSGSSTDEGFFVYDMTNAYADYAESVKRGIKIYDDRSKVLVQDEITFSGDEDELYWFNHTDAIISISEDGKEAILSFGEKKLDMKLLSPADGEFTIMEATPLDDSPHPSLQPDTHGTKLAIHLTEQSGNTTIAVEYTPLFGDQAPSNEKVKITPLSNWKVKGKEEPRLSTVAMPTVEMLLESPFAFANGMKKYIDETNHEVKPILRNDRTMVPLRFVSESLNAEVDWNDETQTASIDGMFGKVDVTIGENFIIKNGKEIPIDSPAFLENGRTYVPLRAVSEAMGKYVYEDNGLVTLSENPNPFKKHPEYLEEIRTLLSWDVEINGKQAMYFHPKENKYRIFSSGENVVKMKHISGVTAEGTGKDNIDLNINGTDYNYKFIKNKFEITKPYLTALKLTCVEEEEYVPESGEEAYHIPVVLVTDTGNDGNTPQGAFDNYQGSRWTGLSNKDDDAQPTADLTIDFGEVKDVEYMYAAFYGGLGRSEIFDIETSLDGKKWRKVYEGQSEMGTTEMQPFELIPSKARYVKYVGYGNTAGSSYNSVTEIRFYETKEKAELDAEDWTELDVYLGYSFLSGEYYNFKTEAVYSDSAIKPLSNSNVVYSVSDTTIASIDEDGVLEIYEPGEFNVNVSYTEGRITRKMRYVVEAQ